MENKLIVNINNAGYSDFKLENIFFELEPGELLLVSGESGSGKTTLLYSITGLIKIRNGYVNGSVMYRDINLLEKSPLEILEKVMFIPQEPWYGIVGYTVYTEYCHTLSVYGLKCRLDGLVKTDMINYLNRLTYTLSAGEYQRLLLSEAFIVKPEILLFDEPFTYIDQESRPNFVKYIEDLINEKNIVIVVDHIPSNWASLEPKHLILNNGRVKYYGKYIETDLASSRLFKTRKTITGDVVLKARNIWFKYPGQNSLLKGVNIDLRLHEIIGLRGPNGSGKTTLLKILAGLYKPVKGFVEKHGSVIYVPENPLLYFTHPTPRLELENSSSNLSIVDEVIEVFRLKNILDKPLRNLSSGERRRLALASAFLRDYDIYLLDEPTGGLDYYSLISIIDTINYIVERNRTVLVTHHDPRLSRFVDKEYLLRDGVLVECS